MRAPCLCPRVRASRAWLTSWMRAKATTPERRKFSTPGHTIDSLGDRKSHALASNAVTCLVRLMFLSSHSSAMMAR